jgi:hypothetical protein
MSLEKNNGKIQNMNAHVGAIDMHLESIALLYINT